MQHYLNDGPQSEIREIRFNEDEVKKYCEIIGVEYKGYVPELFCAKLWPEFTLFQEFINEKIYLKETKVYQTNKLVTCTNYKAELRKKEVRKIKNFNKYTYTLKINKDNNNCIYIEQIFIKINQI